MELWDLRDEYGEVTGHTAVRGSRLNKGDFHLVVFVILRTEDKEYLISKRVEGRPGAGMWETVGGAVVAGEDSLTGAIREVEEEVGLTLEPDELVLLERRFFNEDHPFILDVYRYEGPIDITQLKCQVEEVAEVKIVDEEEMLKLVNEGPFFNQSLYKESYYL